MGIEQRRSVRKILKTKALVTVDGCAPMRGRTVDVSATGICAMLPDPLEAGQIGQISFKLLVDGRTAQIVARAKAAYCVVTSDEFRVGFQFVGLDVGAISDLARYLR